MHGFGISTTETGEGLEAVRIQMLRREKERNVQNKNRCCKPNVSTNNYCNH
jgi:hypothetical protein